MRLNGRGMVVGQFPGVASDDVSWLGTRRVSHVLCHRRRVWREHVTVRRFVQQRLCYSRVQGTPMRYKNVRRSVSPKCIKCTRRDGRAKTMIHTPALSFIGNGEKQMTGKRGSPAATKITPTVRVKSTCSFTPRSARPHRPSPIHTTFTRPLPLPPPPLLFRFSCASCPFYFLSLYSPSLLTIYSTPWLLCFAFSRPLVYTPFPFVLNPQIN